MQLAFVPGRGCYFLLLCFLGFVFNPRYAPVIDKSKKTTCKAADRSAEYPDEWLLATGERSSISAVSRHPLISPPSRAE